MSKKNKMVQLVEHLEACIDGLPATFEVESFYQSGSTIILTLTAPNAAALQAFANKVSATNGYNADTIVYEAKASVDNGEREFVVRIGAREVYSDFALTFEGSTGSNAPHASIPLGTCVYLDGSPRYYGLAADTAYTFHVHPYHRTAFAVWACAMGIEVCEVDARTPAEVA
jgi:hypothetical protein